MKCELCRRDSGDGRLCRVCSEAIQRVIQIKIDEKRTQIHSDSDSLEGKAAAAGR